MAITTTGISPIEVTPNSKAKSKEKDETAADAFSSLMNAASNVKTETQTQTQSKTDNGKNSVTEAFDTKKTEYKAPKSKDTTENAKEPLAKEVSDDGKTNTYGDNKAVRKTSGSAETADKQIGDEKVDIDGITDSADMPDEQLVGDVISELTDMLKDLLDVDDDELEKMLAETGYTIQELLLKTNLNDFILQVNDATSVDALINEDLNNLLKTASQLLDNLTEKFDISDVDVDLFIDKAKLIAEGQETSEASGEIFAAADETFAVEEDKTVEAPHKEEKATAPLETKETDKKATRVTVNDDRNATTEEATEKAATDTDTESFGGQGKQDAKAGEQIINNLNQAINNIADAEMINQVDGFEQSVSEADIVRQIIDDIKVNMSNDTTSLELQLNPQHLGKVQISVSTRNGVMQAQIVTESEAARHAVEAGIAALKETFENQGLKVDAIEVMVATYEFFGNGEEQANKENTNRNDKAGAGSISGIGADEEADEAGELEQEMMQAQGNTVSYMA